GGWAVDALAGEQTCDHGDLDLVLDRSALASAVGALRALGYREDEAATPGLPARLVMTAEDGGQVDFHPLAFDRDGNGWQELSPTGRAWGLYPRADLGYEGHVEGRSVRCTSPRLQHRFRMGYEWSDRDEHFVRVLHRRFRLPVPPALS
ncbi:MAG: amino acid transporter, partial [Thermoleophilia bacterium]|nr:amino acid transporter [Thermoleophilia bacterium]